jgi:hypothetical protein
MCPHRGQQRGRINFEAISAFGCPSGSIAWCLFPKSVLFSGARECFRYFSMSVRITKVSFCLEMFLLSIASSSSSAQPLIATWPSVPFLTVDQSRLFPSSTPFQAIRRSKNRILRGNHSAVSTAGKRQTEESWVFKFKKRVTERPCHHSLSKEYTVLTSGSQGYTPAARLLVSRLTDFFALVCKRCCAFESVYLLQA